jgi:hypothetical protein
MERRPMHVLFISHSIFGRCSSGALHRVWSWVLNVHRFTRPQLRLLGFGNVATVSIFLSRVLRSVLYVSPMMATVPSYKSSYNCYTVPKNNQMTLVKLFLDAILEMELGEVRR